MAEDQKAGQVGTRGQNPTPAPTPTEGSAGTPEIKPEAVAEFLKNRQIWGDIKVPTPQGELPLSEVVAGYSRQQDATRKWQEAARMREEAEKMRKEMEQLKQDLVQAQQDPWKKLVEMAGQSQASPPPDPLAELGDDEYTNKVREVIRKQEEKIAELRKSLEETAQKTTQMTENARKEMIEQMQRNEAWRRLEQEMEVVRKQFPGYFTGRVEFNTQTGEWKVNPGDNPAFTLAVLQIANTQEPQSLLGNRKGIETPLVEIAQACVNDIEQRVQNEIKRKQEEEEKLRKTTTTIPVAGVSPLGELPLSEEIAKMPENTPEERKAKAEAILKYVKSQIPKGG